jgi:hypothetical protein
LKQQLFAAGSVSISLRPGASGVLKLSELDQDPTYQELERNLLNQRDLLFRNALSEETLEGFRLMISRAARCLNKNAPDGDSVSTDDIVIVIAVSAGASRLSLSE